MKYFEQAWPASLEEPAFVLIRITLLRTTGLRTAFNMFDQVIPATI